MFTDTRGMSGRRVFEWKHEEIVNKENSSGTRNTEHSLYHWTKSRICWSKWNSCVLSPRTVVYYKRCLGKQPSTWKHNTGESCVFHLMPGSSSCRRLLWFLKVWVGHLAGRGGSYLSDPTWDQHCFPKMLVTLWWCHTWHDLSLGEIIIIVTASISSSSLSSQQLSFTLPASFILLASSSQPPISQSSSLFR